MSSTMDYARRRRDLIGHLPILAGIMPETEPLVDLPPPLTPREQATFLRQAANQHGSTVVVLGWGDGTLPIELLRDPFTRQKRILVGMFAGEEPAFAKTIGNVGHQMLASGTLRIIRLRDRAECEHFVIDEFASHELIASLGGISIIDGHPLVAAGQVARADLREHLMTLFTDRPLAYGNDLLDSFTGLTQSAHNAKQLLAAPTLPELAGIFPNTPVIAIGAGPSLKRHLDTLRRLRDRCVLVACDAVYPGLVEAGIDPHFVTPLERTDDIMPHFRKTADSKAIYAGLPVCVPELIGAFGDDRCVYVACGDRLYDWLVPELKSRINSGMSTGTLAVSVALAVAGGPVYLVGHDLATDANVSHWEGATHAANAFTSAKVGGDKPLEGMEDRLVPGNDGGMVKSIGHWDRFRFDIAHTARMAELAGRTIYNVNAHDRIFAKIDSTLPAPLPDPDSLPLLPEWRLPARQPERYARWRESARKLPADGKAFQAWATALRADIHAAMQRGPTAWDPAPFATRFNIGEAVSEGNRQAFSYFLRSALHNANAEGFLRQATSSTARSRWVMLETMADLCASLDHTLGRLAPALQEIADEHA